MNLLPAVVLMGTEITGDGVARVIARLQAIDPIHPRHRHRFQMRRRPYP